LVCELESKLIYIISCHVMILLTRMEGTKLSEVVEENRT